MIKQSIAAAFSLVIFACATEGADYSGSDGAYPLGNFLVFECSGEEPFWHFRASPDELLYSTPGPDRIIEETTSGGWASIDENAGRYVWNGERGKEFVIVREQCTTVSSEILSYRLERRDMPSGCCRRFSE